MLRKTLLSTLCNEFITTSPRRFLKHGTLKMMVKMPIFKITLSFKGR